MFLQCIQSELDKVPDMSGSTVFDVSRLEAIPKDMSLEDLLFVCDVKVESEKQVKTLTARGKTDGARALNTIASVGPTLKPYISFYQEEDFYI